MKMTNGKEMTKIGWTLWAEQHPKARWNLLSETKVEGIRVQTETRIGSYENAMAALAQAKTSKTTTWIEPVAK